MTEAELRQEIWRIKKPTTRVWPPMSEAELAAARKWETDNPEAAKRFVELEAQLEALCAAEDKRRAEQWLRQKLHSAGVGARTIEVVRSSPASTPALEAVREWLKTDATWLLLAGDVGTGKSVAASHALAVELALTEFQEGRVDIAKPSRVQGTGAFRRASAVVRMSVFDEGARELALLKSVATLVVDDLGTEHATSWGQSLIHEIFDTRHDDKLRTIITTNIKRDQLKAALGDRLSDRIAQDGKVVCLEGKSMRRQAP